MRVIERLRKVLVVASTLPAHASDPVPAFVAEQATALHGIDPSVTIDVLAPHNAFERTRSRTRRDGYTEYRFHYFWPFRFEVLAGRGIGPALKRNKLLYLMVPFLIVFESIAILRHVRRLKPDVLYVHWFMPQAVAAMPAVILFRVPLVVTTHASDVAVLGGVPGAKALVQFVSRRTQFFTAVSTQTADRLRSFWPRIGPLREELERKLSIVPMGTYSHGGDVSPRNESKHTIVFIGRLVERKGVRDLLDAFARIRETEQAVELVIAGDGQSREQFQAYAKKRGIDDTVTFLGHVSGVEKAELFSRASVVCLPSVTDGVHAEGLPVVFMEGLAAGAIVVASDVTGAQEWIDNGINGYIFTQRDVTGLSEVLRQILHMPLEERLAVRRAAKELSQNFEWRSVAQRQYTVLEDAYHASTHS